MRNRIGNAGSLNIGTINPERPETIAVNGANNPQVNCAIPPSLTASGAKRPIVP